MHPRGRHAAPHLKSSAHTEPHGHGPDHVLADAYAPLKGKFLNHTDVLLASLDEQNFVFQGPAMMTVVLVPGGGEGAE